MQRKLTITVADDVYRGLHQQVGRGEISRFIESLVRPLVIRDDALEQEYREAAGEEAAESGAREWIEAGVDEGLGDEAW
jgi:predicted CopG family antitoxin